MVSVDRVHNQAAKCLPELSLVTLRVLSVFNELIDDCFDERLLKEFFSQVNGLLADECSELIRRCSFEHWHFFDLPAECLSDDL